MDHTSDHQNESKSELFSERKLLSQTKDKDMYSFYKDLDGIGSYDKQLQEIEEQYDFDEEEDRILIKDNEELLSQQRIKIQPFKKVSK